jgi:hypothetical protein
MMNADGSGETRLTNNSQLGGGSAESARGDREADAKLLRSIGSAGTYPSTE